jgi:hypothetical protein
MSSPTTQFRQYKTGARPSPRHTLLAAQPYTIIKAPPAQFAFVPPHLDFWGNQNHGCCVTTEEAFAKACYNPEIFISEAEAIAWATQHDVLEGADLTSVLDWMATGGFVQQGATYDDGGKLGVNYADEPTLQSAISQGPVKIAIDHAALPANAGPPNGWHAVGSGTFTNTDHCVSVCGYGPTAWLYQQLGVPMPSGLPAAGYLVFTWSSIGFVDHPWIMSTCVEAWLRNPTTVIVGPTPQPGPTPGPGPLPPSPSPSPSRLFGLTIGRNLPKGAPVLFRAPVPIPAGHYDVVPSAQATAEVETTP